jgi:hypothetical protein
MKAISTQPVQPSIPEEYEYAGDWEKEYWDEESEGYGTD